MKKSIADSIKEQIASHKISMRPKAFYTAGAVLLGIGFAASLLVATLFVGIALFRLRVNGAFDYLRVPHPTLTPFIENIPWIPLVIAVLGLAGGLIIMRKFEFSYKHAFFGVASGFLVAVVFFGYIADATGIPERAETIESFRPFMHTKYANDFWVQGTVLEETDSTLLIGVPNGSSYIVYIVEDTIIIPDAPIQKGEWVRVIGENDEYEFEAEQIIHKPSPRKRPHYLINTQNTPWQ